MTTINRTLPPNLQRAMAGVGNSLALKVRQTEAYARQKQLANGLTSGTQPSQRIGNYDAVPLPSGELSAIYLGRESASGQFVVLKGPNEIFSNEVIDNEARMLSLLQGEGIVKYHKTVVGPALSYNQSPHYLVEEFIFGVPASKLRLDYPEKIHVLLEAVTTLGKMHRAGVNHQDYWQGNMIVSDTGTLTTIDFNCCHTIKKPKAFRKMARVDQYLLAKRMGLLFANSPEQTSPIAQLLNTIGREGREGESSPYPYQTCNEFLDAIYETLHKAGSR